MQVEAAYLAGFVDGEGSITITEHRRRDRPGYMRRNVRLQVYNTNEPALRQLQSEFGGTVYCMRRPLAKWKDQFCLVWSEAAIVNVLNQILPFLRIKQRQGEIALEYQSYKIPAVAGRKLGHTDIVLTKMQALYAELRRLNKRGKDAVKISAASSVNGRGSAQSSFREESPHSPIGGARIQPG